MRVYKLEIKNFRGIKSLDWSPCPGINCLIGSGDSGKSTILDALELCIGARRNISVSDSDFYLLDVESPIQITATIGALSDELKRIDAYGMYLRSFNCETGEVGQEPEAGHETVLVLRLTIGADLEPVFRLISDRAEAAGHDRSLNWKDRATMAPTRLGNYANYNFSWQRGSLLNRLSEERADTSAELLKAARDARASFGDQAKGQLAEALEKIDGAALELGIPIGGEVQALLDAHSISFSGGTVSLHDGSGIPLRSLGLGSTRLLTAGLQKKVEAKTSVVLIDEVEHGLEPHRIMRLLDALGAKDKDPELQVFMTSHSPVVVRELSCIQLWVVRPNTHGHEIKPLGETEEFQGTIRLFPDALLAPSVLVCEGATEVGFIRGIDQYRQEQGGISLTARGVALVDGGGSQTFKRANAFAALGYRVAVLRDSDVDIDSGAEATFEGAGGIIFSWQEGCAIEDMLFRYLTETAVMGLLDLAIEFKETSLVEEHIRTASSNSIRLDEIQMEPMLEGLTADSREALGSASKLSSGWFKSIGQMEKAARSVIAPDFVNDLGAFAESVDKVFAWIANGGHSD